MGAYLARKFADSPSNTLSGCDARSQGSEIGILTQKRREVKDEVTSKVKN